MRATNVNGPERLHGPDRTPIALPGPCLAGTAAESGMIALRGVNLFRLLAKDFRSQGATPRTLPPFRPTSTAMPTALHRAAHPAPGSRPRLPGDPPTTYQSPSAWTARPRDHTPFSILLSASLRYYVFFIGFGGSDGAQTAESEAAYRTVRTRT